MLSFPLSTFICFLDQIISQNDLDAYSPFCLLCLSATNIPAGADNVPYSEFRNGIGFLNLPRDMSVMEIYKCSYEVKGQT